MQSVEIADYGLTCRTSIALMRQLLSKTPMVEMLGVELVDYGLIRQTLIALMGKPLSGTPMV
jgi:hypothetical protein